LKCNDAISKQEHIASIKLKIVNY
jgi:hypothetical protein